MIFINYSFPFPGETEEEKSKDVADKSPVKDIPKEQEENAPEEGSDEEDEELSDKSDEESGKPTFYLIFVV